MHISAQIGWTRDFKLETSILIYRANGESFGTVHPAFIREGSSRPELGPGRLLDMDFIRSLSDELGTRVPVEILPENVLARTADQIVWWSPARHRSLFFSTKDERVQALSGKSFPHPALLFRLRGRLLTVRALRESARPTAETPLFVAPYWNTAQDGDVCQGSMRTPETVSVTSIQGWEDAYFKSAFTHPHGIVRLTSHPEGFAGLWESVADRTSGFPSEFLLDAQENLRTFVEG